MQADNISERDRASAFGILAGVSSAAFVFGTLAARFLPTPLTFQVKLKDMFYINILYLIHNLILGVIVYS